MIKMSGKIKVAIVNDDNPIRRIIVELPMDENILLEKQSEVFYRDEDGYLIDGQSIHYEHDLFQIEDIFDFNDVCKRKLT